jgi:hypothetical protein
VMRVLAQRLAEAWRSATRAEDLSA